MRKSWGVRSLACMLLLPAATFARDAKPEVAPLPGWYEGMNFAVQPNLARRSILIELDCVAILGLFGGIRKFDCAPPHAHRLAQLRQALERAALHP